MEQKNEFIKLYELDVRDKVEKKNELSYLSWAYAWAEIKKLYPDAKYTIHKFGDKQLPYVFDEKTGYMVFTDVTIKDVTHEMWLPVMDGANKTMLDHTYSYTTKNGEKSVEPALMFDINKTIMRCLTKNLAMFGLGLSLYQGEDLPAVGSKEEALKVVINFGKYKGKTLQEIKDINKRYLDWLYNNTTDENIRIALSYLIEVVYEDKEEYKFDLIDEVMSYELKGENLDIVKGAYKVERFEDMTIEQLEQATRRLKEKYNEV